MTLYWLHSHKSLINIQLLTITVIFLLIILPLTCFVRNRFLITFHIPDFHFDEIILWEIHSRKNTSRSFPHSWLITGFVNRLTWQVPLVGQELLTLPEHLSSPPLFSGVRATRSLVLCVCFVDHCLSFCTFSFGHGVVSFSSIYGFWLPLWYLQTVLFIPRYRSLFHCHIDVIILNCYSTTAPDNADKPIL